ncbi:hypothetical protein RJ639_007925 [Escallonia herrerae]|uniref:Glutathione synthetase n=1 Tax=Escallonia herrerae TaxID=1293975 RepID=A0AA88VUF1_9ASTE|nr:hypothetical protein RJ639_007925 [Escallonia herrerae]
MGAGHSSSCSLSLPTTIGFAAATTASPVNKLIKSPFNPTNRFCNTHFRLPFKTSIENQLSNSTLSVVKCSGCSTVEDIKTQGEIGVKNPMAHPHSIDQELLEQLVYDALVWSSLHGLVVGDRSVQRSGTVPGVGMVHAPFALLPLSFPESRYRQACELAPIFNELVDRVSLDGNFLQDSLSRLSSPVALFAPIGVRDITCPALTKKVDPFTSRLLEIHSKMLEIDKKEEIRLGLHRSDYMLDEQTNMLLQIELNTISSSFPGLSSLVSELHRSLLDQYREHLKLDSEKIPRNTAVSCFAEALAKAWTQYDNPRSVVLIVVQSEERNMYDQHWLCTLLKERYPFCHACKLIYIRIQQYRKSVSLERHFFNVFRCFPQLINTHNVTVVRKTLTEIDAQGELLPDGTLIVGGKEVAVVYFRAGYAPTDYPSELEWGARLLIEQSSAIKCPSISYHLAGTKKIQQELAKPNVLERFLENEEDIAKVRRCFAGLWSLDDVEVVKDVISRPELYVMKPQREGGGNNIYGDDVRKTLQRLQSEGTEEDAAFILMQRIFPTITPTILMRDGIFYKEDAVSELGIYGAYLRNKEKVLANDQCGYLMRTKVSSSNEGGVAAGFAVLDSIYLD